MNIYHTPIDTTDFDLENQLMLEAQVKYALATDHTHIIDANDILFEIETDGDEIIINEIEPCECTEEFDDEEDCEEFDEIEDILELDNPELIDLIINNSLLSEEPIGKEQADTMLVLAQLKHVLLNS